MHILIIMELKKKYGYRCAVCKDLEGTPSHLYPDKAAIPVLPDPLNISRTV